ncbi:Hypothetical protein POVR2_LOCUS41 [uncultured virus]|nr:Hypothetical protein POVR2_LOCUS41 [uncultured virus]
MFLPFIVYEVTMRAALPTLEAMSQTSLWSDIVAAQCDQNWWHRRVEYLVGTSVKFVQGDWKRVHKSLYEHGLTISTKQDLACPLVLQVLYEIGAEVDEDQLCLLMVCTVAGYNDSQSMQLILDDERFGPTRGLWALCAACDVGPAMTKVVLSHPSLGDSIDLTRITSDPLVRAVGSDNIETVRLLLADPRLDRMIRTSYAMSVAISDCHMDIAMLLIADKRAPISHNTILMACQSDQLEVIEKLVADPRVDIGDNDNKLLEVAMSRGHLEIAQLLLAQDRVHEVERDMMIRLHISHAIGHGHISLVKLVLPLIDMYSDVKVLLAMAVCSKKVKMLQCVLQHYSDYPYSNRELALPLREARRLKLGEMESILLDILARR